MRIPRIPTRPLIAAAAAMTVAGMLAAAVILTTDIGQTHTTEPVNLQVAENSHGSTTIGNPMSATSTADIGHQIRAEVSYDDAAGTSQQANAATEAVNPPAFTNASHHQGVMELGSAGNNARTGPKLNQYGDYSAPGQGYGPIGPGQTAPPPAVEIPTTTEPRTFPGGPTGVLSRRLNRSATSGNVETAYDPATLPGGPTGVLARRLKRPPRLVTLRPPTTPQHCRVAPPESWHDA